MDCRCPTPTVKIARMKITLEPELERTAGSLDASQCRRLASVYKRWARELEMKAAILETHSVPAPQPRLRRLPLQKLLLN
jgi:hypothetical protein